MGDTLGERLWKSLESSKSMTPFEHWKISNVVSPQKDGQLAGLVDKCMTGL